MAPRAQCCGLRKVPQVSYRDPPLLGEFFKSPLSRRARELGQGFDETWMVAQKLETFLIHLVGANPRWLAPFVLGGAVVLQRDVITLHRA